MDEKKFYSLLRQFNEFEKNKNAETPPLIAGRIPSFNPEESDMLLASMETIRNNFHFSERREYTDLAKDFLADQITADDFSFSFIGIYDGIEQEVAQMEKDESLELTNFLKTSQFELTDLLLQIYSTCDYFGHVIFDEKELKDCAQTLLLKLQ